MSNELLSEPRATWFMTRASRFTFILIATILLGTALFSASSAHKTRGNRVDSASASTNGKTVVSEPNSARSINKFSARNEVTEALPFSALLPQSPPAPETIVTYAADCMTPKSAFIFGEIACAKLSGGPPLSIYPRKITWVDTNNNILQKVDVTTDPQTDLFIVPAVSTSTDYRGEWRVNDISAARSSVRASAFFSVSNPAQPAADLSVYKGNNTDSTITAGSNIAYTLWLSNKGPDAASSVQFTDATPANTTFLSGQQDSGPTFNCTFPAAGSSGGTTTCTLASFAPGASAKITLIFNVNAGTAEGTTISNTGNISSNTPDPHDASNTPPPNDPNADPSNNTATSRTTVVAGTAGATCTLECPANITTTADTTENGQSGSHVSYPDPSATGNCGVVTSTPASGTFFPVGTTVVTATSQTGDGSCSFTVTVQSEPPPTITCPPDKTANADSTCQATVDPGNPTTTGSGVTVSSSRSDGHPMSDPYQVGTTTITWTASNSSGTVSCQQTVSVRDATAPTITCPANITTNNDPGQCSATLNPGTATATDNCDTNPTVTSSRSDNQPLNAPYPKGTTTITWTATDSSGNSSSCAQTVTVNDTEAPVITCPANITTGNDPGQCSATVNPGTATATDNCGSTTVTGTRSDGQALNASYPKGTTTITWTATDGSANSSSCTQTVTVNDTEAPKITCPTDVSVTSPTGSCAATVNLGVPTATDNCDGTEVPVPSRSDNKPITDPFPVGTTTVTWTATDSSGNHSSCNQNVVVLDNEPPRITCPSNVTTTTDPGTCSASNVNPGTATATDNCSVATVSGMRSDGQPLDAPYPKGTTTITWTATDLSGNKSSCTETVTVVDNEPPRITCPAPASASADANCQAPVPDMRSGATASDNCGQVTVTQSPAPGTMEGLGPHPITLTATDSSGNSSSCTTTFTVNDTTGPTITLSSQTFSLSPPNHHYHTFQVTDFVTSASDNCDTSVTRNSVYITSATSDEAENGPGSGNTLNDIVIASDCKSIQLRAEREGGGNGRVYTIYLKVKDASGNVTTATVKVYVPVNPGGTAVDDGPHYTVTSSCP
jgi:uncharacterized repeat protein (TIGR01451 family)